MPRERGAPHEDAAAGELAGALGASLARVDGVPSEQLWRAAVLAARQAAVSAAELREAFEATRPPAGA